MTTTTRTPLDEVRLSPRSIVRAGTWIREKGRQGRYLVTSVRDVNGQVEICAYGGFHGRALTRVFTPDRVARIDQTRAPKPWWPTEEMAAPNRRRIR